MFEWFKFDNHGDNVGDNWTCDSEAVEVQQLVVIDRVAEVSPSQSQPVTSTPVKQVVSCEPVCPDLVTSATELSNLARIYSTLIEGKPCLDCWLSMFGVCWTLEEENVIKEEAAWLKL